MSDHDDHFDEFDPHTRLKHYVLRAYLLAWSMKLLNPRSGRRRVWFVDGFAGRGSDSKGNPGSPTIACQVALAVRAKYPGANLGIICVEANPTNFRALSSYLEPFRKQEGAEVILLPGTFVSQLDRIRTTVGDEPVLAFLDPFGLDGLDARTYEPMLRNRGSEIFALVADAGARRLCGALNANDDRFVAAAAEVDYAPTFFPDLDADRHRRIEKGRQAQQTSAAASRRIIQAATGDPDYAARLEGLDPEAGRASVVAGIEAALRTAGGTYQTRIGVRAEDGTYKHLLVHATGDVRGVLAMKDAISQALSNNSIAPGVRERLRSDHEVDVGAIADIVARAYRGTSTDWATDLIGARDAILIGLPIFTFQMKDLKVELRRRKMLSRSTGKEILAVPA